jgi:hypothetical protein
VTSRHKTIIAVAIFWFSAFLTVDSANAYEFPPYQGITLKFLGEISGNYSNNVTFQSDKENRIEDFRTMLNLGLDFQYRGKRRFLGFSGRANREIFEDSSDAGNPSENFILSFTNDFTKHDRLSLRNSFKHTREPHTFGGIDMDACIEYYEDYGYSESESETICNEFNEEFGRYRGYFDSYSNSFNASYTRNISEKISITPNYNYSENWSSAEGTNDSESNGLGLSASYKYSQVTRYNMSYSYKVSEYEEGNNLSRKSFNVGLLRFITKRFSFNGRVGQNILSNGDDSIFVNTSISGEIDKRTTASLSYFQGTEISGNTSTTFDNRKIAGSVQRVLRDDLKVNASTFYGVGEYSPTNITDDFFGASINLSYVFWEGKRGSRMSGNLGYSYSNLKSSDEDRNYERNSARFGLLLGI